MHVCLSILDNTLGGFKHKFLQRKKKDEFICLQKNIVSACSGTVHERNLNIMLFALKKSICCLRKRKQLKFLQKSFNDFDMTVFFIYARGISVPLLFSVQLCLFNQPDQLIN